VLQRARVARWFIFKQKIQIWVNFGGALDLKMLIYFMAIWNILWAFGMCLRPFGRYILRSFSTFFWLWYHEENKSGNPAVNPDGQTLFIFL
jgi:hypothetical protein